MAPTVLQQKEAGEEDVVVVVVGAGIAGLAVALGLHRKGVKCRVLESSPELRASGFAIATWRNALQALDALGVGDKIRKCHLHLQELQVFSSSTGEMSHTTSLNVQGKRGPNEMLCVRRDWLLRALEEGLPSGTIRYSSKIVLIGCDGVNSVVAKWLGLPKPSYSGRLATRGLACYPGGHGLDPKFKMFFGHGFRLGVIPCNDFDVYWFFTWSPSEHDDDALAQKKQFVLTKLRSAEIPAEVMEVVERSDAKHVLTAPLRFRPPLSLLLASISKGNVCVAGDALHPMTPDLGQGGCAALEDGVVLARCLGDAILGGGGGGAESERIEAGLREYARIRRWRSAELIGTAYVVGFMQESSNAVISFLRDNWLAGALGAGEDAVVIVGAGIAGLAVALGLHRKGVKCTVLESSPELRASGFAIATWRNALQALDALGVGDKIRKCHLHLQELHVFSSFTGEMAHATSLNEQGKRGPNEMLCVRRDWLLRALEEELPEGTIRYSSKIVEIEEDGDAKILHLADGAILRAKVVIGCDGVNSVVAKWLGLAKPSYSGRLATRGLACYPGGHGFDPKFKMFFGHGFRLGVIPCNDTDVYWFFTWSPSEHVSVIDTLSRMNKKFVLTKLNSAEIPAEVLEIIERSEAKDVLTAPLRFRPPLSLLLASISKGNVCVAGDALHPMTPDLGQGGCAALEDGVVLARCLGDAILGGGGGGAESERIEAGLREYARIRRWRSAELIGTAYAVGFMQESSNAVISFLRDNWLAGALHRSSMQQKEAGEEAVVVVGAGIAGLAVALGLHRKGVKCSVLESSPELRASGFAFATWTNAWQALDNLGVGDKIRKLHLHLQELHVFSSSTGEITRRADLTVQGKRGPNELRCVRRDWLLRALEEELPKGTIRYSSKIVAIEEDGNAKIIHLADGAILRAKVLIGCDGVNSVVAKWLGLTKPSSSGRLATRGLAHYPDGHGLDPRFKMFVGHGFRAGVIPCNETDAYWFFTWSPSEHESNGVEESAEKMKQFVLTKLRSSKIPTEVLEVVERSNINDVVASPLRFRPPLSLLLASISKGNACVAGDALHPMTPDLGQGGCAALEDGVVLARCLGDALLGGGGAAESERIEASLREYARIRRWRSVELVGTAYVVGIVQQSNNAVISFLRDKWLAGVLAGRLLKMADYDSKSVCIRTKPFASMQQEQADGREIVIAGAGLAGLAVALGLHRKGLRSVVLESSPTLRTSGLAFITWTNAFRALDALGVGDKMRSQHQQIQRLNVMSSATGEIVQEIDLRAQGKRGTHEARCVSRTALLLALEEELPRGTIRYSSKIVSIEEDGNAKILHLSDGSTLRAKVLIGCDGINSVVARWLGLAKPSDSGRTATRGRAKYPDGHGFEPRFLQLVGQGFRAGMVPCNDTDVYWFFTWSPSPDDKDVDKSSAAMKQFVLTKLRSTNVPPQVLEAVERSEMNDVLAAPLRFRSPLSLPFASISKGNVCVAGDALHPTTPDLAQGACTALEDAVVLARCLGEALLLRTGDCAAEESHRVVEAALRRYADARRWRSAQLTGASYAVGFVQQSDHPAVGFLRDKLLSGVLAKTLLMMPDYDCGTLSIIQEFVKAAMFQFVSPLA
uniref:FAD-binding domain-containing protein n=1 Tax=Oryza nivara TaxID=4536 RepID=A0A0E0GGY3_ORYNI